MMKELLMDVGSRVVCLVRMIQAMGLGMKASLDSIETVSLGISSNGTPGSQSPCRIKRKSSFLFLFTVCVNSDLLD